MDKIREQINIGNKLLENLSVEEGILMVTGLFEGEKAFSTSFGIEDQLLTHYLNKLHMDLKVFTLDTGRQFNETYEVFDKTQLKYKNLTIEVYSPDEVLVKSYVKEEGINGFYTSVESRKKCCYARKVAPLKKALKGVGLWITGLRAEQSDNREKMSYLEWDDNYGLVKFNPLLRHSLKEIENEVELLNVPINNLYKKGYLSIGCAPCTRALFEGEDFRAGRWWWEESKKECGLHVK